MLLTIDEVKSGAVMICLLCSIVKKVRNVFLEVVLPILCETWYYY